MPLHERIQTTIHLLESNLFNRVLKVLLIVLLLLGVTIIYDWEGYHNFSSQEAMDSAQLARNLSQGKGYTTSFVRPFSIYLLQKKKAAAQGSAAAIGAEAARVNNNHPDLANPPVYPVFLASLMKAGKFNYQVSTTKSFWSKGGYFQRYHRAREPGSFHRRHFPDLSRCPQIIRSDGGMAVRAAGGDLELIVAIQRLGPVHHPADRFCPGAGDRPAEV